MPRADVPQVRALVAAYAPVEDGRRALALHADAVWTGPPLFEGGVGTVRVVPCRSPLAVREALVDHGGKSELLVVLTPCSGVDLGLDVRTRLVKGDVLPLDPFGSILALFGAQVLDPELVGERWLIDDLIELAPASGWVDRLPLGGVLDVDLAWRVWHAARLGLDDQPVDLAAIISLGDRPEVGAALAALTPDRRARVATVWARTAGDASPVLVDLLADHQGHDLPALGLVAGVLWAPSDNPDLAPTQMLARARMEDRFGRDRLSVVSAAEWATAAAAFLESSSRPAVIVDAAEGFLIQADAIELSVLSDVLPRGFDLRLRSLGRALSAGDAESAVTLLEWARQHRFAERRQHRTDSAEAAVRLLRRRDSAGGGISSPTTFAAAAAAYAVEGAYVDEAIRLLNDGDNLPELTSAYAALAGEASDEQADAVALFTALLVEWSKSEPVSDMRIIPLEHLLTDVVAPIAADAPVMVVVCDGMGLPVAHELLRDLLDEHWAPAAPDGRDGWPVGVALLPTVTEVSRTALLTGERMVGGQAEERTGFAAHPALRAASGSARPPLLFHKASLVGPTGTALPDEVRDVVADPDQRVVGVVGP